MSVEENQKIMSKLVKLGKAELVRRCTNLGIVADMNNTAKEMATWIMDEVDDLSTWMEAKRGVQESNAKKVPKGKMFLGFHPITKEELYI